MASTPWSPYKTTTPALFEHTTALPSLPIAFLPSRASREPLVRRRRAPPSRTLNPKLATSSDHHCPRFFFQSTRKDPKTPWLASPPSIELSNVGNDDDCRSIASGEDLAHESDHPRTCGDHRRDRRQALHHLVSFSIAVEHHSSPEHAGESSGRGRRCLHDF